MNTEKCFTNIENLRTGMSSSWNARWWALTDRANRTNYYSHLTSCYPKPYPGVGRGVAWFFSDWKICMSLIARRVRRHALMRMFFFKWCNLDQILSLKFFENYQFL